MASKLKKAGPVRKYFKAALYGKAGTGKSLTALLFAEGLAKLSGKRIAYFDTEEGTAFYSQDIADRTVHPKAFDFDRVVTRKITDILDEIEAPGFTDTYGVVVIDAITHIWEAAKEAYTGKRMSNGQIPIQGWGGVKKPYLRLMHLLLTGEFHSILCGREGLIMEEDEDGETKVTGTKMKAEGETPHEPDFLARMATRTKAGEAPVIALLVEKDRTGILSGKSFIWPNFDTIAPLLPYLGHGDPVKLDNPELSAEADAERIAARDAAAEEEKQALYIQIRDAITVARTEGELKAAWSLVSGKKTHLGPDRYSALEALKDGKKQEVKGGDL